MEGGIATPNPKIRYRGPVTYSAGIHTSTTFQIVSASAEISPESTWNSAMLSKGTLDLGAIYARPDQIKGVFPPHWQEIRYRKPGAYIAEACLGSTFKEFLNVIRRPISKINTPSPSPSPNLA